MTKAYLLVELKIHDHVIPPAAAPVVSIVCAWPSPLQGDDGYMIAMRHEPNRWMPKDLFEAQARPFTEEEVGVLVAHDPRLSSPHVVQECREVSDRLRADRDRHRSEAQDLRKRLDRANEHLTRLFEAPNEAPMSDSEERTLEHLRAISDYIGAGELEYHLRTFRAHLEKTVRRAHEDGLAEAVSAIDHAQR